MAAIGGFTNGMVNARFVCGLIGDAFGGLAHDTRKVDTDTASAIVTDIESRMTAEFGHLFGQIGALTDRAMVAVGVHATSSKGAHEDYALFVEKGHASGVADDAFFAGDGHRALRPRARKGYAAPKPFFYPAIVGPLTERWTKIGQVVDGYFARIPEDSGS